ncbi:MAG: flagella basal body P-ring formation protein FlgA [Brevundimonas sp.]
MRALIALLLVAVASPALADPVSLRANPQDDDGRVTLGDIFDGAGAASGVVVAERVGPSVMLPAAQVQAAARAAGLEWTNPQGLRRVVVRRAPQVVAQNAAPAVAGEAPTGAPVAAVRPAPAGAAVIARGDAVQVSYEVGGVRLTVTGRAQRAAALGQPLTVINSQSGRAIEAVAAGPGRAIAGPAALQARADAAAFPGR